MANLSRLSDKQLEEAIRREKTTLEGTNTNKGKLNAYNYNEKQALGGLGVGVASIGDIPALAYNLGAWFPEQYAASKYGKENVQKTEVPYYFHDTASQLADLLIGKPQDDIDVGSREMGDLFGSLINPYAKTSAAVEAKKLAEMGGRKALSKMVGFNPEKYELYKEAGLNPSLGEVSDARWVTRTENLTGELPGGASQIANRYKQREEQLDAIFKEHMPEGSIKTPEELGASLKGGAKGYNEKAKEVGRKLYNRAFSRFNKNSLIYLDNTKKAINAAMQYDSPEALKTLISMPGGKAIKDFALAMDNNLYHLSYNDLKKIYKSKLKTAIKNPLATDNEDVGRVKYILDAIDKDMRETLLYHHPEAAKDLAKADNFWNQHSKENRKIANNALKENASNLSVFNSAKNALIQGDAKKAHVLTARLTPEEKQNFSSTMMNELGRVKNEFDANQWAQSYLKMRDNSRKILTSGLGKDADRKLLSVAKSLDEAKKSGLLKNNSATTYTAALSGQIYAIVNGLTHIAMGNIAPGGAMIGAAGTSAAGTYYLASKATNKKLIDAMYKISKGGSLKEMIRSAAIINEAIDRAAIIKHENARLYPEINIEESEEPDSYDFSNTSDEELEAMMQEERDRLNAR